jgi:hypothetical protein
MFFILENDIRDFVEGILKDDGEVDWWSKKIPQGVRDTVSNNKKKESQEGLPPRSDREIEYTNFGELGEIISFNWAAFEGVFSRAPKDRVIRVINRLNMTRNAIAHCSVLAEDEVVRLKLFVNDWYKLML